MSKKTPKENQPAKKRTDSSYDMIRAVEARKRRRNMIIAAVVIVLVVAGAVGAAILFSSVTPVSVGSQAHDFSLKEINANCYTGNTISLSSKQGSVVLLEFMVEWCPNCKATAPFVEQVYTNYTATRTDVYVLAVAELWTGAEGTATLQNTQAYISSNGATYPFVLDDVGSVAQAYGVTGTPTFFVIGKTGIVDSVILGAQSSTANLSNAIWAAIVKG